MNDHTKRIYLDNNATTLMDPIVIKHMHELALEGLANPASQHYEGRRALHLLEEAKTTIMECVGAPTTGSDACQILLTSGGTESNNLAVLSSYSQRPGKLIVGGTDHPSVIEAAKNATRLQPDDCLILPVDARGQCDLNLLEGWLQEFSSLGQPVSLVSIMLGNNETGIVQNLKPLAKICRRFDVPVHSDVVQAVGKMPVDMLDLGLSAMTLTAHKIHGPVGVGAFIYRDSFPVDPMIVGGGQQLGFRAGTEAVIPACGLASALQLIWDACQAGKYERIGQLRDQFEAAVLALGDFEIIAADAPRLPHTSSIAFKSFDRQALQMAFDLQGLACSTGSACSSGSGRPAGSLVAMGLDEALVLSSLRFSFSRFSTLDEVDRATNIIHNVLEKQSLAPSRSF